MTNTHDEGMTPSQGLNNLWQAFVRWLPKWRSEPPSPATPLKSFEVAPGHVATCENIGHGLIMNCRLAKPERGPQK
jgi:hypothetical protein